MKKILIIISEKKRQQNQSFIKEAQKLNINLDIKSFQQIRIQYINKQSQILIDNKDISIYDVIYIKNTKSKDEFISIIAQCCIKNKISLIDTVFTSNLPWFNGKGFEYAKLIENNLPVIDSLLICDNKLISSKEVGFEYPLVVKVTDSSKGMGVHLVKDKKEIDKLFDYYNQPLLIQKFVENDGDYRLLVVGDKVIGSIKRVRNQKKEFRNNIAYGARGQIYQPSEYEKKLAIKAAKCLKYQIAGIDLIKDGDQIKIMEVNRSPLYHGLMKATGVNVHRKILQFLNKC